MELPLLCWCIGRKTCCYTGACKEWIFIFFNYKKSFSIVWLAPCDASYQFAAVNIGEAGRQSDGGVFANSNLGRSIVNDYFNLPQPKKLYSESEFLFPYVFVGDDAFPMRHNLLKPYSSSNLERVFLIFNYRLSRARRIIENTFGINAARFRIFCRPILSCLETVENITKACVALHNYLMANKKFGETHIARMDLLTKMFNVMENGGKL